MDSKKSPGQGSRRAVSKRKGFANRSEKAKARIGIWRGVGQPRANRRRRRTWRQVTFSTDQFSRQRKEAWTCVVSLGQTHAVRGQKAIARGDKLARGHAAG